MPTRQQQLRRLDGDPCTGRFRGQRIASVMRCLDMRPRMASLIVPAHFRGSRRMHIRRERELTYSPVRWRRTIVTAALW
jgi:hypothetical protein